MLESSSSTATSQQESSSSSDALAAMAQHASSVLRPRESIAIFHTPPPVDKSRSWLVEKSEQESYGSSPSLIDNNQPIVLAPVTAGEGDNSTVLAVTDAMNSSVISTTTADDSINSADNMGNIDNNTYNADNLSTLTPTISTATTGTTAALPSSREPSIKSSRSSSTSLEKVAEQHEQQYGNTTNDSPLPPPLPRRRSPSQHSDEHHQYHYQLPSLPRKLSPLVDSFIHSLKEPRYMTPLSGDEIANLYQDFYGQFASKSEDYVIGDSNSILSKLNRTPKEVQMETYREIAEKKRERSLRPSRIKALTESAETAACEAVYSKIFNVSFGDDRARNEYIQSRARALKEIPITLEHLALPIKDSELLPLLSDAGAELINMDHARNPRLKLHYLLKTHKVLVAALTEKRSDQTSADSILPALLFTFIYYETPNLWLNMNFIKRFRNKRFLQGEDMYCLTNFEAAVAFLETLTLETINIDISSIPSNVDITPLLTRPDSDPLKNSSPRSSRSNSLQQAQPSSSPQRQPIANSGLLGKRLSTILYPTDLATNAVNSADQSIKSISSTVGSSYRFLVGRFLDKKDGQSDGQYPDTLADARLVIGLDTPSSSTITLAPPTSQPPSVTSDSDQQSHNLSSSPSREPTPLNDAKLLSGPQKSRSRSSSLVNGNDSIIGKFAGGVIRNFRSPSFGQQHVDDVNESLPDGQIVKIPKPIERLLTTDTESLRISDIKELHADYKRLVKHLKSLNAFD